jgi:iron(III) transport system permease protein
VRRLTALHWVAGAAALIALSPLLYLVVRAGAAGLEQVWSVLARTRTLELSAASLGLALAVAGTCVAFGIPLAWLATRAAIPGGRLWLIALSLPLAIPSYVTAYTWLSAFPGIAGFIPAWAVLTLSCLPYVILPVAAVLSQVDPAYDDVARTLGDSPLRSFRRTTAPLLFPAAGAGGLLVALYTLSDFGRPSTGRRQRCCRWCWSCWP